MSTVMTGVALLSFAFFTAASALRLYHEDIDQHVHKESLLRMSKLHRIGNASHPLAVYKANSFNSIFFMHLTHTGGTSLRSVVFTGICEDNTWLHCWQSQVDHHGKTIPTLKETGKKLDILYGHFAFDKQKLEKVMTGRTLMMTILRDPYEVARSNYYHMKSSLPPAEWLKQWDDLHLKRLSGLAPENQMCEHAKQNLRYFHLITETKLLDDFSPELFRQLQRMWPNLDINQIPMKHDNQISSRVDRSLHFDSQISQLDRTHFNEKHACAYEVLELGRTLPSFWHGS